MSEQMTLLTVQEVAARLRANPQTIRRWLREGKLSGRMLGGTKAGYRVPASEVERLSTPEPAAPSGADLFGTFLEGLRAAKAEPMPDEQLNRLDSMLGPDDAVEPWFYTEI